VSGTDGTGVANEKAPDGLASRGLSLEGSESSSSTSTNTLTLRSSMIRSKGPTCKTKCCDNFASARGLGVRNWQDRSTLGFLGFFRVLGLLL
jgi:hypothetical protein